MSFDFARRLRYRAQPQRLWERQRATGSILTGQCQFKGVPIGEPDDLIAASALEHDLTMAMRNVKDAAGLGVVIFNPWEPENLP